MLKLKAPGTLLRGLFIFVFLGYIFSYFQPVFKYIKTPGFQGCFMFICIVIK